MGGTPAVMMTAGTTGMMAGAGGMTAGTGSMMEAGAGGTMAGAGGSGGSMAGTMAPTPLNAPCITAGSQVVFLGDSYSSYALAHTDLYILMGQRASMNGALPMGMRYVNYAVAGTTLATLPQIPGQWDSAKSAKPIYLVIMDGGGNDVLIDNQQCLAAGSQNDAGCKMVVANSVAKAKEMWASMKMEGVSDVIWFWYPHIPGSLAGDGHDINDYGLKEMQKAAMEATSEGFRPVMIDTIPLFEGHDDFYFGDGIHANDKGENAIADAIWKYMKDNCIGQGPTSGCCKM
jgi:lysophospholipase L1-like esterase